MQFASAAGTVFGMPTPARQLAEIKTGGNLDGKVATWRKQGLSWRQISTRLAVDHDVNVSDETLRLWFKFTDDTETNGDAA